LQAVFFNEDWFVFDFLIFDAPSRPGFKSYAQLSCKPHASNQQYTTNKSLNKYMHVQHHQLLMSGRCNTLGGNTQQQGSTFAQSMPYISVASFYIFIKLLELISLSSFQDIPS